MLIRKRRTIVVFTAIGMLLALAIAINRDKTYTTTFSFIPQSSQDGQGAGLANLAGQFGISLGGLGGAGQTTPPQLYADLLLTREVLVPIAVDSFQVDSTTGKIPLADFLRIKGDTPALVTEKTVKALQRNVIGTSVAIRTTGMVTVSVRTESPNTSFQIANRLLEGLHHFNLVTRQSQAREERRFTEGRLAATRKNLADAEARLQDFLQANRDFSRSPSLSFEFDRLQREVVLQQQIVTTLAQQYEENRIQEVRDTPVITVMEAPTIAARANPRMRLLILMVGTVFGFGLGVFFVMTREAFVRQQEGGHDPGIDLLSEEWRRLRGKSPS